MRILALLLTFSLSATEFLEEGATECPAPWFTGPLLTTTPHVIPKGYIDLEPYLFYEVTTGFYDNSGDPVSTPTFRKYLFNPLARIGLTEKIDMLILPNIVWQETLGVNHNTLGDFEMGFGYQILHDTKTNKLPSIKVYVQETFPTGKYDRLNPDNFGTDSDGEGSYQTQFGFVIGRLLESPDCHFLSLRFNLAATLPSTVKVSGLSVFGGAPDTDARVRPGICYMGLFGLEYSLTQNWAFAFDAQLFYQRPTTFKGFSGTLPNGDPAPLGNGEGYQFSMAPAIEYNFSEAWGIIAGAWFSLAGRNQSKFASFVIALNYFGPEKKGPEHKYRMGGGIGGGAGGR